MNLPQVLKESLAIELDRQYSILRDSEGASRVWTQQRIDCINALLESYGYPSNFRSKLTESSEK